MLFYYFYSNPKKKIEHMSAGAENSDNTATCDITKPNLCNVDHHLHPIMDPEFNMREVAKQCILLEDHLNNTEKHCHDCIKKHMLAIEGLLEEAISLEKNDRTFYRNLYSKWIEIEKEFIGLNESDFDKISIKVRSFRKPLVAKFFDYVKKY